MKMKIEITKMATGFLRTDKKLAEIEINNGHWRFWENHMECEETEKIPLTINNIHDAFVLNQPVKDAYGLYNSELWKEERKLVVDSAMVRRYENLLGFLNCRINNAKEDYKKWGDTEKCYTAVLFEEEYYRCSEDTVVSDIRYEKEALIEVKIEIIG